MRYKWFVLVLVCILLLCGCKQTELLVSETNTTTVAGTTDFVSIEPPYPTESTPPEIQLNGAYELRSGTSQWTFCSLEGEIKTICADAFHPAHGYRENYKTIFVNKDTSYPVTITCDYTPEEVTVRCFAMEGENTEGVSLPVTAEKDEKGNTVYRFGMKTDGFYAYDILFKWKRFDENNSAHYSCYSRCDNS